RRVEFRLADPAADPAAFKPAMVSILVNVYGQTPATANAIANVLLPDVNRFQIGNTDGFLGNGRRLADDVVDIELNLYTGGKNTTDNVGDDNGLRVTDGSVDPVSGMTRAIAFPYLGAANLPLNGPGTGPNP